MVGFIALEVGTCVVVCPYPLRFPCARDMSYVTWERLVICAMPSPRYIKVLTRANEKFDTEKSLIDQKCLATRRNL